MLYNVTDSFVKVTETKGTIQNNSQAFTVEIADNTEENTGFWLFPLNRVAFSGDVYLRCIEGGGRAQVNVVSFITDSGGSSGTGGGSYVDDSQVAPDSDIDSLIDDIFGSDDSTSSTEPQVAPDADIDSLIDDIFNGNSQAADFESLDDGITGSNSGAPVDDSLVASDEDIDNLIDDIFG